MRELVQLAKNYDPNKHRVAGWFMSEKLDGMRALWVPETRNMPLAEVPWANAGEKNGRVGVGTGLWSRYGNVISAPDWWLDKLPGYMLDGELYMGRNSFQTLRSVVGAYVEERDWSNVQYVIFDAPGEDFWLPEKINNKNYKHDFSSHGKLDYAQLGARNFSGVVTKLGLDQQRLPTNEPEAQRIIDVELQRISRLGGEGLILRHPYELWFPKRSTTILKVKPVFDAIGTVTGLSPGKGKYQGMLGSLQVSWENVSFNLSGMTDAQREMGVFQIGDEVEFVYRELSDDGVPKEARFICKICKI